MSSGTIYLVVIIGFFVVVILRTVLSAVGFKVPTTIDAWKTYVRGPGILQLGFLILGALVVVPSVYLSPPRIPPPVSTTKEYRIDPSKQVVYQENIQAYSHLILFARSQGPEKSAARLTILRNRTGEGDGEISRIENITNSTWTRLDLDNSYANMTLMVEPSSQADSVLATQVDLLLYLKVK
jgi:hypothetical protein